MTVHILHRREPGRLVMNCCMCPFCDAQICSYGERVFESINIYRQILKGSREKKVLFLPNLCSKDAVITIKSWF